VRSLYPPTPNVDSGERAVSVFLGGLLAYYGIRNRRSAAGWLSSALGGVMLERGFTGRCPAYGAMGIDTAQPSELHVRESMQVMRPRQEVYAFWRDFANLARFMEHVRSVDVREGGRSHWKVRVEPGPELEWDAELVLDQRGERLAWRTLPGSQIEHSGEVSFHDLPAGRGTGLHVAIGYQPPAGPLGASAAYLLRSVTAQQVREDLRRFKSVIETGETPTIEGQSSGRLADEARREAARRRFDDLMEGEGGIA
jgi:uncharacterized membrane protein